MFHRFWFCLCLWSLDAGVFGDDDLTFVSVKKGDSVTLNSDFTEIMDDDQIQWRFWIENALIADINVTSDKFTVYDDVLDGRFRDRLELDNQTGSLTITNFTAEHNGVYTGEVIKRMRKSFILAVYDEISVKKGDPVTLNSDLTEIMDGNMIQWIYKNENDLTTVTSQRPGRITIHDDVLDGRFRNRLKLDNQTGSLTITDTRTEHAGRYLLMIFGPKDPLKAFSVSVYNSVHCCGFTEAVIRLVLSALVGVAIVVILIYDIRSRRTEQNQTDKRE